ncbi:hypothetical protein ACWIUD_06465 [Helicobacter sp. 23-1044]
MAICSGVCNSCVSRTYLHSMDAQVLFRLTSATNARSHTAITSIEILRIAESILNCHSERSVSVAKNLKKNKRDTSLSLSMTKFSPSLASGDLHFPHPLRRGIKGVG